MTLYLYTAEKLEASLSHGAILCTQEQADEYYLMHYRTKGSKNGERRYQDEQGRLTPEGYRHYAEMYGWGSRLKKAEKLQNTADQKSAKAASAVRRSEEDVVKAYKANQKNERRTTDRRQMKADQANARSAESRVEAAKASLDARKAQDKATAYANKLARKDEKLSKYMNDDGTLNEEGLKKYTVPGPTPGSHTMSLVGRLKFGKDVSDRVNQQNRMTKAEYKDWEQKVKALFDKESEGERQAATDLDAIRHMAANGDKRLASAQTAVLSKLRDPLESFHRDDPEESEKDGYSQEAIFRLREDMRKKSGDWYYGESKTEGHKKICDELNKFYDVYNDALEKVRAKHSGKELTEALKNDEAYQSASKKLAKLEDDLMGQVLRDMGYPDTPENRKQAMFFAYREH